MQGLGFRAADLGSDLQGLGFMVVTPVIYMFVGYT